MKKRHILPTTIPQIRQPLPLGASPAEVRRFVEAMYTDSGHLRTTDPGQVDGNVVFAYLDAFDPDTACVDDLKAHYRRGGLGDVTLKRRLCTVLEEMLAPIRERRSEFAARPEVAVEILREGTERARTQTSQVLETVRDTQSLLRL